MTILDASSLGRGLKSEEGIESGSATEPEPELDIESGEEVMGPEVFGEPKGSWAGPRCIEGVPGGFLGSELCDAPSNFVFRGIFGLLLFLAALGICRFASVREAVQKRVKRRATAVKRALTIHLAESNREGS